MPSTLSVVVDGSPVVAGADSLTVDVDPSLRIFVDGVDVSAWAPPGTLTTMAQMNSTPNQISPEFSKYYGIGSPAFPVTTTGGMLVWFGHYYDGHHADDRTLFAGRIVNNGGNDRLLNGNRVIKCASPLKELKAVLDEVNFSPIDYPTDISRVARLLDVANLPGWTSTAGITSTVSVTYPSGPLYEAFTPYIAQSFESILNDIATDPGIPGVTAGYPVATRRWWISGVFVDPTDPTQGINWVLMYRAAADTPAASKELKDTDDGVNAWYFKGATWDDGYQDVVRSVRLEGPKTEPQQLTWRSDRVNVNPAHGFISKNAGADATWDTGAASIQRIIADDWQVTAISQEHYLAHATFQTDDGPKLLKDNTKREWESVWRSGDTVKNTMSTRGQRAFARLKTGHAMSVLDCQAATCITRSHFYNNREGQQHIFRYTDPDNYWKVENTGGAYSLIKVDSGSESMPSPTTGTNPIAVTPVDGQEVKVFQLGPQIQVYINNVIKLQVNGQTFNEHATKHGLAVDCDAAADSWEASFSDFQCTDLFTDKAFGLGTDTTITSYTDILYGFVFGRDGVVQTVEDGTQHALGGSFDPGYHESDKYRISTYLSFDRDSASLWRLFVWERMAYNESTWTTLRTSLVEPGDLFINEANPLFVQFAAADLGATLTNIQLRKAYSNVFHADPAVYGELEGEWPNNGVPQFDYLNTYAKRKAYADAFFDEMARPRAWIKCSTLTRFSLGELVTVTNTAAGWTGGNVRQLIVTEVSEEVQQTNPRSLIYHLTLGTNDPAHDMSGPRHLLKPKNTRPDNVSGLTQSEDGDLTFEWDDPVGDQNYGRTLHVQVKAVNGSTDNAQLPTLLYDPYTGRMTVPKGMLNPDEQYALRSATELNGEFSDWAESAPFTVPPQEAYRGDYSPGFDVGDGVNLVLAGAAAARKMPESGTIVGWSITTEDPLGDIDIDVQVATPTALRALGNAAYTSITASDPISLNGQKENDGAELAGWTTAITAGNWLRYVVKASPTPTVTQVSAQVHIARADL